MTALEFTIAVSLWICIAGVFYTYVGYAVAVWACAAAFGRRRHAPDGSTEALPRVSMLIVAHNEEESIEARLANALALDYPSDRLEIVIASDGSTDRTVALASRSRDPRVRVVDFADRRGKAAVLNQIIPTLTSEIVALSDANTVMERATLRRMVRWFGDQQVGVVVGRLHLTDPTTGNNVDGLYWKYETFLKRMDARLGALLGANGAVYTLPRRLFTPLPADTLVDDLVLPLLVRMNAGCELVYDESAIAHEETPSGLGAEFKRRCRIGMGGFQSLTVLWPLLLPSRGWIAFTFLSHKVLRWTCPFLLLAALALNLLLVREPAYRLLLITQVLFYTVAAVGAALPGASVHVRLLRLTTMFVGMHAALLTGWWRWAAGMHVGTWERTARSAEGMRANLLQSAAASDAPIRVVHLVIALEIGGLEMVVANLARQIDRRFQLHVICLEGRGPIAARVEHCGVPVEVIGRPDTSIVRSIVRLRRRLAALRPDVIHTHNEKAHIRGALASVCLLRRPALIHTRHGESRATGWSAIAQRLAIWRSGFVVSVSERASAIARAEGASAQRTRVIRNGIDVAALPSTVRREGSRARVVAVGRLTPVKDFVTMLWAVRIVAESNPAFHLDIVGDGPSRNALERLRHTLGLDRHVTFHGASENPTAFLAGATLFVQSSLSEGISLTLLEAMAAGVPVVATRVGGTPEVVEHGVTGLLVPAANATALATAILAILNDDALAERMGRAARSRAVHEFNVGKMAASYEALYEEAVLGRMRIQAA